MKISTEWIKSWLESPIEDDDIVSALEKAGIEVEEYRRPNVLDKNIVVASVVEVAEHPNANKLHLVKVDSGDGDLLDVVCGAENVRPGLKVALAKIGAILPDGTRISKVKLRGVESFGMLCSQQELFLGSDHSGIIELDEYLDVGMKLSKVYPGYSIVDIKTSANRFDLQSIVGLAREVAAMKNIGLKTLPSKMGLQQDNEYILGSEIDCSRYCAVELKVSSKNQTPDWMKLRLEQSGVRSISLLVDITNYVCLELGQPMHVYDLDRITLPITVRKAENGEKITTLDGDLRELDVTDVVVCDAKQPISLAGVIGGSTSQVNESTSRILLEAAVFDGATIRKTAKRNGLRTEASARFERGLPVILPLVAMSRAIELYLEFAGAEIIRTADTLNVWPWIQRIGVETDRLNTLMGTRVGKKEIIEALARLEIKANAFDVSSEVKKYLGKPYKWGAKFRTDGTSAFDCSYLTDYIYSLIGISIGHTAAAQFENGMKIELHDIRVGDLVFRGGAWDKLDEKERNGVSHVAVYVGDGKIVHAVDYQRNEKGEWILLSKDDQKVIEEPIEMVTEDPQFLGIRRYADDLSDYISIPEIPWWRTDLKESQDILEEVVRVVGYDRVPSKIPVWRPSKVEFDHNQKQLRDVKNLLVGLGLFEIATYSFISEDQLCDFGLHAKEHLQIQNPLSVEQSYLRSELLQSFVRVLNKNRGYSKELGIFEVSKVFEKLRDGSLPKESLKLGISVLCEKNAYRKIKGILDTLQYMLGVDLAVSSYSENSLVYEKGRLAKIVLSDVTLGKIGQLSSHTLKQNKLQGESGYLEIDLDLLLSAVKPKTLKAVSKYPETTRDISIVVKNDVEWSQIKSEINKVNVGSIKFLSDYYGNDLPQGYKSVAFRILVSFSDRTPTESDAQSIEDKVVAMVEKKFGATLRK